MCWFALLIFGVSTYMLMCIVASCFGFVCVAGAYMGARNSHNVDDNNNCEIRSMK